MNILQEKFEYTKRVKSEAVNLKTNNARVKIKKRDKGMYKTLHRKLKIE